MNAAHTERDTVSARFLADLGNLAILGGLLSGCGVVASIEPVVPDSAAVFEPTLIGTWVSPSNDRVIVTRDGDQYHLRYTPPNGEPAEFAGRLGYLGGRLVLEISRASPTPLGSDGEEALMRTSHMVFFLDLRMDTLRTATLVADSALQMLNDGRLDLPFVTEKRQWGDDVLLTATTARLRSALSEYVRRRGVIGKWSQLHRAAP